MKILFYLFRFPGWGGIETVTETIGCKLADLGHEIYLLSHVSQDRESALIQRASFFSLPDKECRDSSENLAFARNLIKEERIDVVVYQDSYAPVERVAFCMRDAGAKLLVFEHNSPSYVRKTLSQIPRGSFIKQTYRAFSHPAAIRKSGRRHLRLLKESDAYVLLSFAVADEFCEVCGREKCRPYQNKLRVINNPLVKSSRSVDVTEKEKRILFVGQLNYIKRVDLMFDIWKQVHPNFPGWRFQVVGDGPLLGRLSSRVEDERIDGVDFFGFRQPDPYYGRAGVFWMTSTFEGWPMTLLEAMQAGCVPVVMDTFASVHDIVDDGENGFIVPADDISAFADATEKLLRDDALRRRMAASAIEKAGRFDVDIIVGQWTALLEEMNR